MFESSSEIERPVGKPAEGVAPAPVASAAAGRRSLWKRIVWGRNPRATLKRALGLAVVSFVVFKYVLLQVQISGISMQPTYRDGSWHIVNRLAFWRKAPQRADVVLIKTTGMHVVFLKRIIGLPGETVAIEAGVVTIDGKPLSETYVKARLPWEEPPCALASDEYFVLGDNRATEEWSHRGGPVRREKIVGKLLW